MTYMCMDIQDYEDMGDLWGHLKFQCWGESGTHESESEYEPASPEFKSKSEFTMPRVQFQRAKPNQWVQSPSPSPGGQSPSLIPVKLVKSVLVFVLPLSVCTCGSTFGLIHTSYPGYDPRPRLWTRAWATISYYI